MRSCLSSLTATCDENDGNLASSRAESESPSTSGCQVSSDHDAQQARHFIAAAFSGHIGRFQVLMFSDTTLSDSIVPVFDRFRLCFFEIHPRQNPECHNPIAQAQIPSPEPGCRGAAVSIIRHYGGHGVYGEGMKALSQSRPCPRVCVCVELRPPLSMSDSVVPNGPPRPPAMEPPERVIG